MWVKRARVEGHDELLRREEVNGISLKLEVELYF
jgi:hypothetical protein